MADLPRQGTAADREPARVSTLELFFDLAFVFTITQPTELPGHEALGRGAFALVGDGHAHLVILAGVVAVAAGLVDIVAHPGQSSKQALRCSWAGGTALFLLSEAWLQRTLGLATALPRALAGVALLATQPLGVALSGAAMLTALVVLSGLGLLTEGAARPAAPSPR